MIRDVLLEEETMLNEEVQAWVDLGFSEEEAITMANATKARNDGAEITDDDSVTSFTDSIKRNRK
ncbi:MAG: hypothetical protein LBT43_23110 [Prevotella sp.]|jgi:Holliday junction resolvasome RuvABC DNA-binding subunit|nr:hypothetical protein [Prevotella sp.]